MHQLSWLALQELTLFPWHYSYSSVVDMGMFPMEAAYTTYSAVSLHCLVTWCMRIINTQRMKSLCGKTFICWRRNITFGSTIGKLWNKKWWSIHISDSWTQFCPIMSHIPCPGFHACFSFLGVCECWEPSMKWLTILCRCLPQDLKDMQRTNTWHKKYRIQVRECFLDDFNEVRCGLTPHVITAVY